jgi:hypothetical protein
MGLAWVINEPMMDYRTIGERIMDDAKQPLNSKPELPATKEAELAVDSVTLARLLDEVRNGNSFAPGAYNRVHNRHNR